MTQELACLLIGLGCWAVSAIAWRYAVAYPRQDATPPIAALFGAIGFILIFMTRELFVLIVTVGLWLSLLFVRRIKEEADRNCITGFIIFAALLSTLWLFLTVCFSLPTAFPGGK